MRAMMAVRAAAVAGPPPSPPPSSKPLTRTQQLRPPPPRHLLPPLSLAEQPARTAAVSLLALFSATISGSMEAKAFSFAKEDVISSLTKVENTVNQVEEVSSTVLDFLQSTISGLIDALKPSAEVALPILQKAGQEAIKIASPVVSNASNQAKEALQSAGVDPSPVFSAAKTMADAAQQTTKVIQGAKPIASATVEILSSTEPVVIAISVGTAFLAYLLLPPVWSAISFNFRGYKGNLTPAQTLDLISTQNHLMIDIRSEKDKNKAGIPRLPSSAKNKLISMPLEELPNKIKALVRNVKQVEAEIVAVKISYLKRVSKSSSIVIMDSYSDTAKIVARALTTLGFKNIWIMADGFAGGRGWQQSRLGTDSYDISFAEVISPSQVIPAAVGRFRTTSSSSSQATRKLLPGGIDD